VETVPEYHTLSQNGFGLAGGNAEGTEIAAKDPKTGIQKWAKGQRRRNGSEIVERALGNMTGQRGASGTGSKGTRDLAKLREVRKSVGNVGGTVGSVIEHEKVSVQSQKASERV